MKWLFIIVPLLMTSCSNSKQHEVGQYVYVDCFQTIHTDRGCASKLSDNPKSKEERMANMQGVSFVDTCNLVNNPSWSYKFCPKCVDDEAYHKVSSIMERNEIKPPGY